MAKSRAGGARLSVGRDELRTDFPAPPEAGSRLAEPPGLVVVSMLNPGEREALRLALAKTTSADRSFADGGPGFPPVAALPLSAAAIAGDEVSPFPVSDSAGEVVFPPGGDFPAMEFSRGGAASGHPGAAEKDAETSFGKTEPISAAEEAARIIWGLLYPENPSGDLVDSPGVAGSGPDVMRELSEAIGASGELKSSLVGSSLHDAFAESVGAGENGGESAGRLAETADLPRPGSDVSHDISRFDFSSAAHSDDDDESTPDASNAAETDDLRFAAKPVKPEPFAWGGGGLEREVAAPAGLSVQPEPSLSREAVAEALDTANASAEMNIDAALAVLGDLLDGLPSRALNQALVRTAGEFGVSWPESGAEPLQALADSLDMEITVLSGGRAPAVSPAGFLRELLLTNAGTEVKSLDSRPAETGESALPAESAEPPRMNGDAALETAFAYDRPAAPSAESLSSPGINANPLPEKALAGVRFSASVPLSGAAKPENQAGDPAENAGGKTVASGDRGQEMRIGAEMIGETRAERPIKTLADVAVEDGESADRLFSDRAPTSDNSLETRSLSQGREASAAFAGDIREAGDNVRENLRPRENGDGAPSDEYLENGLQPREGERAADGHGIMAAKVSPEPSAKAESDSEPDPAFLRDGALEPAKGGLETIGNADPARIAPDSGGQTMSSGLAETAGRMAKAESGDASTLLDRLENIQRLADVLRMANRGGAKSLTLTLSPPELGKVMLRVESRNGLVSAFLRVEKPEAASCLAAGLKALRENLKAQGVELGELDIREQPRPQDHSAGDGGQRRRHDSGPEPETGTGWRKEEGRLDERGEDSPPGANDPGAGIRDRRGNLNLFI